MKIKYYTNKKQVSINQFKRNLRANQVTFYEWVIGYSYFTKNTLAFNGDDFEVKTFFDKSGDIKGDDTRKYKYALLSEKMGLEYFINEIKHSRREFIKNATDAGQGNKLEWKIGYLMFSGFSLEFEGDSYSVKYKNSVIQQKLLNNEPKDMVIDTNRESFIASLSKNGVNRQDIISALQFYNGNTIKKELNPSKEEDLIIIKRKEFQTLNDFGLVKQEMEEPYKIIISADEKEIYLKIQTFFDYEKNRYIRTPKGNGAIDNLEDGFEFEHYIANLLKDLNFDNVEVLPASGDYGTDVLAYKSGVKYAIQCKYYSKPVGISAVQEIMGGKQHYNTHIAVVVTNNIFTRNAVNLAESNNIILWDRPILDEMIKRSENL